MLAARRTLSVVTPGPVPGARTYAIIFNEVLETPDEKRQNIDADAKSPDEVCAWLSHVLHAPFSIGPPETRSSGGSSSRFFLVTLPDSRAYLLPDYGTAAAEGLNLTNPQGRRSRTLRKALSAGLRAGVAQRFLPVLWMEDHESSVPRGLEEATGRRPLRFAASLGRPGPVREPVLQLMDETGRPMAYAKIDWTERGMIRREGELLKRLPAYPEVTFLFPLVLYHGRILDRDITVTAAPEVPGEGVGSELTAQLRQALDDLSRWDRRLEPFEASAFWRKRMASVEELGPCPERALIERASAYLLEKLKGQMVLFHFSHGDFVPVNMKNVAGRLLLLDWEVADADRPAGYDMIHFIVQGTLLKKGGSVEKIQGEMRDRLDDGDLARFLQRLEVPREQWKSLFVCYLFRRLIFNAAPGRRNAFALDPLTRLLESAVREDG